MASSRPGRGERGERGGLPRAGVPRREGLSNAAMRPVHRKVVWSPIANRDSLACMSERVLAAARVAALIGDFDRSPAYRGLAEGLRVLITDGRVPTGVRLPSERELTEALGVSRTTVTRAYAELRDRGFLVSRQGSGSVAALPSSRGLRSDHLLP